MAPKLLDVFRRINVLRRFFAYLLVPLALSPFTRPFSTCDLSLFAKGTTRHERVTRSHAVDATLTDQAPPGASAESPVMGRDRLAVHRPCTTVTRAVPLVVITTELRAAVFLVDPPAPNRLTTLRV